MHWSRLERAFKHETLPDPVLENTFAKETSHLDSTSISGDSLSSVFTRYNCTVLCLASHNFKSLLACDDYFRTKTVLCMVTVLRNVYAETEPHIRETCIAIRYAPLVCQQKPASLHFYCSCNSIIMNREICYGCVLPTGTVRMSLAVVCLDHYKSA